MKAPDPDVLSDLTSNPALTAELARVADLIARLRNLGTAKLKDLLNSKSGALSIDEGVEMMVVVCLFRLGLQHLSAIECQVRFGWTNASKVSIRSMFECVSSIRYLLLNDEDRGKRSRAFLYCDWAHSRYFLASRISGTSENDALRTLALSEGADWILATNENASREAAQLDACMSGKNMEDVRKQMSGKGLEAQARVKWHALFGGPKSIKQMCKLVGYAAAYEVLYDDWSRTVHASESIRRVVDLRSNSIGIAPLRDASDLNIVKIYAVLFGMDLIKSIKKLIPCDVEVEVGIWYRANRSEFRRDAVFAPPQ
ncbi:MAG: DUF5677 domain-containing protein [Planctomycetota bacterium]|nr:DUF5677 domain-containing protein [Planctomycetota bacterium]